MYLKVNGLIEKFSELSYFVMVYVCGPGLIFSKAVYSLFNYFSTDLDNDAFELPLPAW